MQPCGPTEKFGGGSRVREAIGFRFAILLPAAPVGIGFRFAISLPGASGSGEPISVRIRASSPSCLLSAAPVVKQSLLSLPGTAGTGLSLPVFQALLQQEQHRP